jgi:SAM-dependent methyltransferase
MDEAFLDERYRASSALWSGKPNPHLVTEAADLGPGAALDVGCGEGADAIWLAGRGWRVTAADLSCVALDRGIVHALEVGAEVAKRIDWLHADLTTWIPRPGITYDLVSAHFMHLPKDPREALFRKISASVSPGGTLLIVGHHPSDMHSTVPRPPVPELFFTAAEVAALLDPSDWDLILTEARARQTVDPDGADVTIHDAVLRAQRKG